MTTDENFKIVKEIETENAKRELIKNGKEKIKIETVAKARKKLMQQRKEKQRKMLVKNKIKPQAVNCVT